MLLRSKARTCRSDGLLRMRSNNEMNEKSQKVLCIVVTYLTAQLHATPNVISLLSITKGDGSPPDNPI